MKGFIKKTCVLFLLAGAVILFLPNFGFSEKPSNHYSVDIPSRHESLKPFYGHPHHPQADNKHLFSRNAKDKPIISVRALFRILRPMKLEDAKKFIEHNCQTIVTLVDALDKMKKARLIDDERYSRISERMKLYGISPEQIMSSRSGDSISGNPIASTMRVRRAMDSGDKKKAEEEVEKLARDFNNNASVMSAAANYYNELQKFAKAEKTATDSIKLDPANVSAYKSRALARISIDDRKGAIKDIEKALNLDPQDESSKILSMLIKSKKDMPDLKTMSSIDAMRKALGNINAADDYSFETNENAISDLNSSSVDKRTKDIPVNSGNFNKSKAFLRTAVSKNRLGDYQSAAKYASLALDKDPNNLSAYLERAISRNFMGYYKEAIADASQVLRKDPSNISALNIRSWALNKLGNFKFANKDATEAIHKNPNFADAWFNRAMSNEKMGNYKQMLEDYKQAATLSNSYRRYFQDAVAQYSGMVKGFKYDGALLKGDEWAGGIESKKPVRHFLMLMIFTVIGGLLIGLGFMHVVSGKLVPEPSSGMITHPGEVSPSVFYEGVTSGKYQIIKKIGEGGMGVVYEAVDQSLERKVALKKMNEEIKTNDVEKQRFLQEARMVALLHHPNIIEIYTIFEDAGDVYLVFEHVEGDTMDKVLNREIRMNFERAKTLFSDIADALIYAHSKNVVHRDLKLSNIMISKDGLVKVMDFGLARRAMESMAKLTNVEIVGSPAYMAPEQDFGRSGKECDIFALGVCFYEIITGHLPFNGPDFHYQKEHGLYTPVTAETSGLPRGIDAFMNKTLAAEASERFQSADEWKKALTALF